MALSPRSTTEAGVDAYLAELAAGSASARTHRAYAGDLGQFARFLHTRIAGPTVVAIGAADVCAFAEHLSAQGRRPRTVARKLTALRGLFAFLRRHGVRADDPTRDVTPPELPVAAEPPSPDQVRALLCLPDTDTFLGARNRALLELLYGAGLRVDDLLWVNLSHLDLDDGGGSRVRLVHGERVTPLGAGATEAVRGYLLRRAEALIERRIDDIDAGALFVSARGRRLRPRTVQRIVERYLRHLDAGAAAADGPADDPFPQRHHGPGILRAACERHLLDAGADPVLVAALLGRHHVRAPARVVDVSELAARYRAAHPRA